MTAELTIALVVGLFGGGSVVKLLEIFIDRKSGLKRMEKEMKEGFSRTDAMIRKISEDFGKHRALQARIRILRFSDEVTKGDKHSEESFRQIMHDIDDYDRYCEEHPEFENSRTVIASKRIKQIYQEWLEHDVFL